MTGGGEVECMICTLSRVCIVFDHLRVMRMPDCTNVTSALVRCLVGSNCAYEWGNILDILRKLKNAIKYIALKVNGEIKKSLTWINC